MGCHGALGATVDEVPQLRGRAGYFARTAAGRAYLAQVPGVARAPLSNDRVAALLNWLLLNYSARELPQGFVPFTEEEVSALRKMDIVPTTVRAQVVRELVEQGVPPQALKLPAPRLY
jgi:hypothetical protein